jgi:hypothetical protein
MSDPPPADEGGVVQSWIRRSLEHAKQQIRKSLDYDSSPLDEYIPPDALRRLLSRQDRRFLPAAFYRRARGRLRRNTMQIRRSLTSNPGGGSGLPASWT